MSRARFRVRIALGVALLALAFAVVLLARGSGGVTPAAPATPGREGASPELAPPPAMAAPPPLAAPSPAPPASTSPAPQPSNSEAPGPTATPGRPALLAGRVRLGLGTEPLPPDARVLVRRESDGALLGRAALGTDGRFALTLDLGPQVASDSLRVLAVARGFAYAKTQVQATAGATSEVELVLASPDDDQPLTGRVLDPQDRPVAGLKVLFTTSGWHAMAGVPIPDPEGDGAEGSRSGEVVAIVVTEADGGFRVRGAQRTATWPMALDGTWHLAKEGGGFVLPGGDPVLLRARPAFLLTARVTDRTTGELLENLDRSQQVLLGERALATSSTSGAGGSVHWHQPIPSGGERGFLVRCTFEADGYRRAEETVEFGPGAWRRDLEVALERMEPGELGRVRFLHEMRDAAGALLPLQVTVWRTLGTNRSGRGHYLAGPEPTLETRAGATSLTIGGVVFGATYPPTWEGDVTVLGGRTTEFSVPFPPTGILRLRAGRVPTVRTLDLFDAQGAGKGTLQIPADAETVDFPAFPVGSWSFGPAGDAAAPRTHFRIAADTVTERELPR